jgi:hypothetical protein
LNARNYDRRKAAATPVLGPRLDYTNLRLILSACVRAMPLDHLGFLFIEPGQSAAGVMIGTQ